MRPVGRLRSLEGAATGRRRVTVRLGKLQPPGDSRLSWRARRAAHVLRRSSPILGGLRDYPQGCRLKSRNSTNDSVGRGTCAAGGSPLRRCPRTSLSQPRTNAGTRRHCAGSTPLAGVPDDVFFEGKAIFEGLSLVRTKDFPLLPLPAENAAQYCAATLAWKGKISDGAKTEKLPDGSVRLSSREPKEPSYYYAPLPGIGMREVIFELRNVSPGFAVYLGQGEQPGRQMVRVVRKNAHRAAESHVATGRRPLRRRLAAA